MVPRTHVTLQRIRGVTKELWEFADYIGTPRNADSFPVVPRIHDPETSKNQNAPGGRYNLSLPSLPLNVIIV